MIFLTGWLIQRRYVQSSVVEYSSLASDAGFQFLESKFFGRRADTLFG